jgi:hypothetical protein
VNQKYIKGGVYTGISKKLKHLYCKWKYRKEIKEYNKQEKEIYETYEFIWGIKSCSDFSDRECSLHTNNDIDITYNRITHKYWISVEIANIWFQDKTEQGGYIKNLYNKFTAWMLENGYDTNKEIDLQNEFADKEPNLYDIFSAGQIINTEFDTLEDLYAAFKFLVTGFVGQENI